MQLKEISDLYEVTYLLLKGCELKEVRCIPVSEGLSCLFTFTGEDIEESLYEVHIGRASVNLTAFREAYSRVNTYIREAKKNYDRKRRELRKEVIL